MVKISLIICTWNNSARLANTLDAVAKCRIPGRLNWELVLVNNNCTDDTPMLARQFAAKLSLVYVQEPIQGLSRARNAGLAAARGELVVFGDDDITPCQDWIGEYWQAYERMPQGFFFGGPVESEFETEPPAPELLALAPPSVRGLDWGRDERILGEDEGLLAANWACPIDILRRIGGFDSSIGLGAGSVRVSVGEESDLQTRLRGQGWQAYYLPRASVGHFVPASKCTLRHIADRKEAGAFHAIVSNGQPPPGKWLFGTPRWLWRDLGECWMKWVARRLLFGRAYREYVHYRALLGRVRGYRELYQSRSDAHVAQQRHRVCDQTSHKRR